MKYIWICCLEPSSYRGAVKVSMRICSPSSYIAICWTDEQPRAKSMGELVGMRVHGSEQDERMFRTTETAFEIK